MCLSSLTCGRGMISKNTLAEPACAIPPPALPACHEYIFLFSESSAVDAPVSRCVNARKLYAHGVPVSFIHECCDHCDYLRRIKLWYDEFNGVSQKYLQT